jgi:hypothetical protein
MLLSKLQNGKLQINSESLYDLNSKLKATKFLKEKKNVRLMGRVGEQFFIGLGYLPRQGYCV